jgi:hypothetical protein
MTGNPTIFGDGVIDVHVANGVARITMGAVTGGKDNKPSPSGTLVVPVLQLGNLAKVLAEVTRQVEQRARDAMAQQQTTGQATQTEGDQLAGAFRFNG